ncbi:hypothetical protein BC332_30252 [Capsicum chinense]|nr:hypothetical protein BC332_30252 [Capsicum chinense]
MKVDQKDKMTADSLLLDDFDDFTTPPPLGLLTRTKIKSDISLAPPSKRRKTNADKKESMINQEKIKGHPYVKEVNEPPSGTSNTIIDPINEEAPHESSLIDFGEQTPTAEQNPPVVESGHESTQKINMSRGTYHEQVLMKVDMNAIESLVKTYIVIEIDSSNKDVEKNKTHGDDLGTPKEHSKDFLEKESETDVKNDAFQHSIDNTIADFSSPVSCTMVSSEAFQELIDNIIAGMSTPIVAMVVNLDDLSQKFNLPGVYNAISTDSSQKSINNIIPGIFIPVVSMKMKSVSPTEIKGNEFQIHDTRFQSVLPEAEVGKQDAVKTRVPRNKKQTTIFRKLKDNHYEANRSEIGFSSLDFVVTQPDSKNWSYTMSQPNTCWNDEQHVNVIFYYLRKKSKQQKDEEYRYTTVNCLFKTYIDATYKRYFEYAAGDSLSTQDDYKKTYFIASNEGALINIIKGFNIPVALPCHLVDDVYVPINYDGNFHRVLVVISLKKRCIWVYDSMLSSQHREPSYKIKRLSEMLPTYISYSGLLENTERTVWSSLESYKYKMSNVASDLNDTPFDVEYVKDIAQQDCGVFITAYAEFLSDQMQIPSSNLDVEYLRKRYATLLWNYGVKKAKKIYSSDHDDPPRVRPFYVPPIDESNILAIE